MKQTLLDQLFYNQDKWRECEKKIAKINSVGNILWVCNLIIMLNSSFVSPKHVLVNVITICYFVLTLVFTISIVIKRSNGSVLTLTCSGIETLEGFFKGIEEAIDHDQIYIQYAQAIIKVDAITYVCGLSDSEG